MIRELTGSSFGQRLQAPFLMQWTLSVLMLRVPLDLIIVLKQILRRDGWRGGFFVRGDVRLSVQGCV